MVSNPIYDLWRVGKYHELKHRRLRHWMAFYWPAWWWNIDGFISNCAVHQWRGVQTDEHTHTHTHIHTHTHTRAHCDAHGHTRTNAIGENAMRGISLKIMVYTLTPLDISSPLLLTPLDIVANGIVLSLRIRRSRAFSKYAIWNSI